MKAPRVIPGISLGAGILALFSCCATAEESPSITSAFAATTVQITAMPDALKVPVEWSFTNRGDIPLAIEKFIESCGCLSGNMTPQNGSPIDPGKSGIVRASFTPGQHRGLLRKSLHVRFVGHEKPVELVVEATIPSPLELSEREITWSTEAPATPRTIDVTTGTGTDFTITGLTGVTESQFHLTRETLTEKRHHRITITPAEGVTPGVHTLLIRTDSPDPRDRVTAVFLRIP